MATMQNAPINVHDTLLANWGTAWATLGLTPPADLFDALLTAWAEPQRHYHSMQHLVECIARFEHEQTAAERPAEVALALWFHDAVYDVQGHRNEQRSADWARTALIANGAPADVADRVHALVMATLHDAAPQGRDAELLIDIDLSILGAPSERFAEYERQIRVEYAHVPPELFEPRRRELLRRFIDRDPLYATPGMRAACEAQAKLNLRAAIG